MHILSGRARSEEPDDHPARGRARHRASRFPRHLSQHVGGFVLTQGRLDETMCRSAMPRWTIAPSSNGTRTTSTRWHMMKVDVLALGMLTCIRKAFELIKLHHGQGAHARHRPNARTTKPVYDMLCKGDSIGVFQVESRAQINMLPRLKPKEFYDLVIQVAIVRPGPIQGDMVHPYLRRRNGEEKPEFPSNRIPTKGTIPTNLRKRPRQDARRAAVPGTGDADRHGGGAVLRRRGQRPAQSSMATFRNRRHGSAAFEDHDGRAHGGARLRSSDVRRALLRPDQGVRRATASPKATRRALPSSSTSPLWIKHAISSRGLRCGAAQLAAHGLLCPGADRPRRPRARRRECAPSTSIHSDNTHEHAAERIAKGELALRLGFRQMDGLQRGLVEGDPS
jgi:hypothetical protein